MCVTCKPSHSSPTARRGAKHRNTSQYFIWLWSGPSGRGPPVATHSGMLEWHARCMLSVHAPPLSTGPSLQGSGVTLALAHVTRASRLEPPLSIVISVMVSVASERGEP